MTLRGLFFLQKENSQFKSKMKAILAPKNMKIIELLVVTSEDTPKNIARSVLALSSL